MDGWFEIRVEPQDRLLRLTMGGFFDEARIGAMRAKLVEALAALGCGPNAHLTLCDITAMNIQSQDMVAKFAVLVGSPEVRSHRLAFVTGTSLARLQARRLTDRTGVAFFTGRDAALAWLREAPEGYGEVGAAMDAR